MEFGRQVFMRDMEAAVAKDVRFASYCREDSQDSPSGTWRPVTLIPWLLHIGRDRDGHKQDLTIPNRGRKGREWRRLVDS